MRPDGNAQNILSTTRATAKMHEFRVAPEDFIALPRDPAMLFVLAVGILGDVAATIAGEKQDGVDLGAIASIPVPRGWGERDPSETHLGAGASATRAAALGIFAHHADTPYGLGLSIEHAMTEGFAKFVICTSTLAQGVNFPLKYLIVTSTRQGGEKILVRDFHNLMGRAGRAGMHTEGSVIFSTPAVFDQRNTYAQKWRWQEAKDLLDAGKSEPCTSSILAIFDEYVQRQPGAPPIVQPMLPQWLDLAFADRERIEGVVNEALLLQPNISANEFSR
jgi:hypothetical protein